MQPITFTPERTVTRMEPIDTDVLALLDRLDPHLDEPCSVPGCVHTAADVMHDVVGGIRAA